MDSPQRTRQHLHGRSGMPDSLKLVATGPDDQWSGLLSFFAVMKACLVIAQDRESINQVIEVLNFSIGTETSQSKVNSLPQTNGSLPDSGILNQVSSCT